MMIRFTLYKHVGYIQEGDKNTSMHWYVGMQEGMQDSPVSKYGLIFN